MWMNCIPWLLDDIERYEKFVPNMLPEQCEDIVTNIVVCLLE